MEIGAVYFPELAQYFPSVVLISGLFFGRLIAMGKPVLLVELK
jgi:hypothetical protein